MSEALADAQLRPHWSAYAAYLFVPVLLVGLGLAAEVGIDLVPEDRLLLFGGSLVAAAVGLLKLAPTSLSVRNGRLCLRRFLFRRLGMEVVCLSDGEIRRGLLSSTLGMKAAIQENSGLQIVPLCVLYLEFDAAGRTERIAFDVGVFDYSRVRRLVARFPSVDLSNYGTLWKP